MKANEIFESDTDIFDLIDAEGRKSKRRKNTERPDHDARALHSETVPIPNWKIERLDALAKELGILININGMPFGKLGAKNGMPPDEYINNF